MPNEGQLEILEAREKILATASDLFAKQGYESTSLSQVAREAKVSKALIFWHFDSKDVLYRSALRRTLEPYFISVAGLADLDERGRVERLIDQFYDFIHENVYSVRFFLSLTLRAEQRPDEGLTRVLELYRIYRDSLAGVIASGQQRGVFRPEINASREAALIMAALAGILIQQFMSEPSSNESAVLIDHLKQTLFPRLLVESTGGTHAGRPE
jgi:TetR/AcrR family transcriptional regulator, transcriptional repressor for nem operon